MQIFAKGTYALGPGLEKSGTKIDYFITKPNVFDEMPDKYANCSLFKDCVKYGLIRIVGDRKTEKEIEADFEDHAEPDINSEKQVKLEEAFISIRDMSKEELIFTANEMGLGISGDETAKQLRKLVYAGKKKELFPE